MFGLWICVLLTRPSTLSEDRSLAEICSTTNLETAIDGLLRELQKNNALAKTTPCSAIEELLTSLKKLSSHFSQIPQLDTQTHMRLIRLLSNAASLSLELSLLATASSLTTSAYLMASVGDDDGDHALITQLAMQSTSLHDTHAMLTGILTHTLTLIHPVSITAFLLRYTRHLQPDQHHAFVVSLAQYTPTVINLLALSNHSESGLQLTAHIIDIDDIEIVNDWAVEAKHQMQSGAQLEGVQRLTHLIKCSILNAFFIQHTGSAIEVDETHPSEASDLPTIDAPEWFKEQSAKVASTQKVYSSNEFRTLRMAAQGIRAPSKHVDSFE